MFTSFLCLGSMAAHRLPGFAGQVVAFWLACEAAAKVPLTDAAMDREPPAQVHVVGVYCASQAQFQLLDTFGRDIDWVRFASSLTAAAKAANGSPEARLWQSLSERSRQTLSNRDLIAGIQQVTLGGSAEPIIDIVKARRAVLTDLADILHRSDYLDEKSLKSLQLDKTAVQLLEKRMELRTFEKLLLNRRLFEASFPNWAKRRELSLQDVTVPVRVRATADPIVLVLCSHHSAWWQIHPDMDARIARVIVGGYYIQDVIGTKAPVSYHVYDMPSSPDLKHNPDCFWSYEIDRQNYPKLAAEVRKLTGQDIATFQGRYSYKGGPPFVVPPEK